MGNRFKAVRLRTITLSLVILVTLILYLLVNVITKQSIDFIDFVIMATLQIVIQYIYFPDGEIFGQQNQTFINNRDTYNEKALNINTKGNFGKLREYCEYEFQKRRKEYIINECGYIGITLDELEVLKQTKIEKDLKFIELKGKYIHLTRKKRKHLLKLIFDRLPIEKNQPETIMSAIENNGHKAIGDKSQTFKLISRITTIFKAVVIGGFLAYIGYTAKDGIGFVEVVKMCMYVTTMLTSAVFSFSGGERCSSVYKNQFYIDLSNFIDGFEEWLKLPNKEIYETQNNGK